MINKKLFIGILLLSLLNIIIFFQRDAFQYQPYANYSSLYSSQKDNLKKWEKFTHDFSSAEFKEAKYLTDSICNGAKSTLAKTLLLSATLFSHFREQIGEPSVAFSSLSPLNQYKQLFLSKTDKLWCGNFAQIFSFFCWSQGIICRNIEIMQPGDRHVLTECYLPETKQWVMVDPTFNLLLVENSKGVPLDLISFK
ncbi:MAG TPA: hypothetical protein VEV15_07995, partial [Flavisolibacter sp.]|nr:hypothetical protein [Flavisolibacter sp.]